MQHNSNSMDEKISEYSTGPLSRSSTDIYVFDYEVLGAGGLRRQELVNNLEQSKVYLLSSSSHLAEEVRDIYLQEIWHLQNESPQLSIIPYLLFSEETPSPAEFHKAMFAGFFPLSSRELGEELQEVLEDYLSQVQWQSWLAVDFWRPFPGYIKAKFPKQKKLQTLVAWEWIQCWLPMDPLATHSEMPLGETNEHRFVTANWSYLCLKVEVPVPELDLLPGLYVYSLSLKQNKIVVLKLSTIQALMLDLLDEEAKYKRKNLLNLVREVVGPSALRTIDIDILFNELLDLGLIKFQ